MKTTLLGSLGILGVLVATAAPSSAFCDHKHGCCCGKAAQGAIASTAPRGAAAGSTITVIGGTGLLTCSSSGASTCSSAGASAAQGACAASGGSACGSTSGGACNSSSGAACLSAGSGTQAPAAPSGAPAPRAWTIERKHGPITLAPLNGHTVAVAPLGGASIARAPLATTTTSGCAVQGGVGDAAAPEAPASAPAPLRVRSLLSRVRGDHVAPAPAAEAPAPCGEPALPCTPCPQEAPIDAPGQLQVDRLSVNIVPDGPDAWKIELPEIAELPEMAEIAELPAMDFDLALPDVPAFEGWAVSDGEWSEEDAQELAEAQREAEEATREAHEEAMQSWRESQEEWRANQQTWQEEARERAREALERAREAQQRAAEQWRGQAQALQERMREQSKAIQERVRAQSEALRERLGDLQQRAHSRTDMRRAAEPKKRGGRTSAKRAEKAPEGGAGLDERIARIEGQLAPGSGKQQDAHSLEERVAELEKLLKERDGVRGFVFATPRSEAKAFGAFAPEAETRVELHGLDAKPFEFRLGPGAWRMDSNGAWKRLDDGQAHAWKLDTEARERAKVGDEDAHADVRAEIEARLQELRARMDELRERMQQLRSKLEAGSTR
ncbi:MAG: hypothetical protein HZA53_06205 [Planctomycetes bacterium]|nr:hypothetical protein [Planctomycetota bacterium]